MNREYFISTNLAFVATAILHGGISIKKVIFHPEKHGVKSFFLTPYERANQLYLDYTADQLTVKPSQLTAKITALKGIQAENPAEGGEL